MKGTLTKSLDVKGAEQAIAARVVDENATSFIHPETGEKVDISGSTTDMLTSPKVPSCFAEDLVGHSIMSFESRLDKVNSKLLENSNFYLRDAAKELTNISLPSGKKASITPESFQRGSIETNMVAAFQFLNTKANVFDFEAPRNEAVSDFYQFGRGGGSQPDANIPNMKGVLEQASKHLLGSEELQPGKQIPFLEPSKNQPDISWLEGRGAVSIPDLENLPVNERTAKKITNTVSYTHLTLPTKA